MFLFLYTLNALIHTIHYVAIHTYTCMERKIELRMLKQQQKLTLYGSANTYDKNCWWTVILWQKKKQKQTKIAQLNWSNQMFFASNDQQK